MDRPAIRCFVAYPLGGDVFTDPAVVSLELALELREKGYAVLGPDPDDEIDLATYERLMRHPTKRRWFEGPS
jgi:hypothetical protein